MKLYEFLNKDNWVQGAFQIGTRRCLLGATEYCYSETEIGGVLGKLKEAMRSTSTHSCLIAFNDNPRTTVEDVIRLCKIADV